METVGFFYLNLPSTRAQSAAESQRGVCLLRRILEA